ncbi:MAG: hypothetical protein KGL39_24370 [Patescibacteria group bacterium]|nr:hypothetical protein [Patescibacteria group bacterium]
MSVPVYMSNEVEHRRQIAQALNNAISGKLDATLDVTLTPNATSTTIQDVRLSSTSAITPAMALTSSGATAVKNGIYVDTVTSQNGPNPPSAVIHHASSSAADQTIRFLIVG